MQHAGQATIDLQMTFPQAGIGFMIHIRPGEAEQGSFLDIHLQSTKEGKDARFVAESSYALADFVGGFCRWLGTKRVKVSHDEQIISGHFDPRYTMLQLLATAQEMCEMLNDKFASYPHSILN